MPITESYGINLAGLPADIIRKIIGLGQCDYDAMLMVSDFSPISMSRSKVLTHSTFFGIFTCPLVGTSLSKRCESLELQKGLVGRRIIRAVPISVYTDIPSMEFPVWCSRSVDALADPSCRKYDQFLYTRKAPKSSTGDQMAIQVASE